MSAVKDLEGRYTYGDYRMVRKCVDAVLGNYPAVQEFEMLVLSFYQKLNRERAGIIEEIRKTGRIY